MDKRKALNIAIQCMEGNRKQFSAPYESAFGKIRSKESQDILDAGIKEIDEALIVIKAIRDKLKK